MVFAISMSSLYGGEYHVEPDRRQADRKAWAEHVFFDTLTRLVS